MSKDQLVDNKVYIPCEKNLCIVKISPRHDRDCFGAATWLNEDCDSHSFSFS